MPHVIEPSHGLDRIIYSVLEHSYTQREDGAVLRLPSASRLKVGVFPLMARDGLDDLAAEIDQELRFRRHRDLL